VRCDGVTLSGLHCLLLSGLQCLDRLDDDLGVVQQIFADDLLDLLARQRLLLCHRRRDARAEQGDHDHGAAKDVGQRAVSGNVCPHHRRSARASQARRSARQ
jgi:hypothetical protein